MKIIVNGVVIDTEGKDEAAVNAEIQAAYDKGVEGLTNKNTQLLGEKKTLQAKLDGAVPASEVETLKTDLQKAKDDLAELEKNGTGDYKALYEKAATDHAAAIEAKDTEIADLSTQLDDTIISNELNSALATANINPVLADSASQILRAEVKLVDQDGKKVARVGDKDIKTYVDEWAGTDVGKNFIMAGSSGGSKGGGHKPGSAGDDVERYFNPEHKDYSVTKQTEVYRNDRETYDSMKDRYTAVPAIDQPSKMG